MSVSPASAARVVVIGAGPAGLMAAEALAEAGCAVTVHERMPSAARKFLMAGRGGLNLTHSEPLAAFMGRYGDAENNLRPFIEAFAPSDLIDWCEGLGQPVFTGTSGRVFPQAMKASPLLRAWLARLARGGVDIRLRQEWRGWDAAGALRFSGPDGDILERPDATVLALGGASWPRLGADGGWTDALAGAGVSVRPLRPANMGLNLDWSPVFRARFAGAPVKGAAVSLAGRTARGDLTVSAYGLEGGPIYALTGADVAIMPGDRLMLDLKPDLDDAALARRLEGARRSDSLANRLRKAAGLSPAAVGLLREAGPLPADPAALARRIKAASLTVTGAQGLGRAISSAGGVAWSAVDETLMLKARPGVFVAGEMLDWSAPTGGYLLQASFATGRAAGRGAAAWIAQAGVDFAGAAGQP